MNRWAKSCLLFLMQWRSFSCGISLPRFLKTPQLKTNKTKRSSKNYKPQLKSHKIRKSYMPISSLNSTVITLSFYTSPSEAAAKASPCVSCTHSGTSSSVKTAPATLSLPNLAKEKSPNPNPTPCTKSTPMHFMVSGCISGDTRSSFCP